MAFRALQVVASLGFRIRSGARNEAKGVVVVTGQRQSLLEGPVGRLARDARADAQQQLAAGHVQGTQVVAALRATQGMSHRGHRGHGEQETTEAIGTKAGGLLLAALSFALPFFLCVLCDLCGSFC